MSLDGPSSGVHQQDQEPAAQAPDADAVISVKLNVTVREWHIKLAIVIIAFAALLTTMALTNPDLDDFAEHHLAELSRALEPKGSKGAFGRFMVRKVSSSMVRRKQPRRTNLLFLSVFWWKNRDGKEVLALGALGCIWGGSL
jgi:hypothetical protein